MEKRLVIAQIELGNLNQILNYHWKIHSPIRPQIVHRNLVVNIPHRLNENFQTIGSPIKLSDTPVEYRHAPPELGEHTAQILSRFKTAEELAALKEKGIIDGKIA